MPRSYGEPEKSFKARMQLSLQMDGSVPAFYAKAESEREYAAHSARAWGTHCGV